MCSIVVTFLIVWNFLEKNGILTFIWPSMAPWFYKFCIIKRLKLIFWCIICSLPTCKTWDRHLYHFRHFLGSPGVLGTLLCTLKLQMGLKILVNQLSKMFNNSKRCSFRKIDFGKEIHTFKNSKKLINRNYKMWENTRFLIWQLFWPWRHFSSKTTFW